MFRNTLGGENYLALEDYVISFENNLLKRKYPNSKVENAYRKITYEPVENLRSIFKRYFDEPSKKKFLESQLWNEIFAPADSVWMDDDAIVVRFIYRSIKGDIPVSLADDRLPKPHQIDSTKNEMLKWVDFNKEGKYFQALQKLRNRNRFFEEYVETKNIFGVITPGAFNYLIENCNPDLDDKLNKIIIAVELSEVLHNYR